MITITVTGRRICGRSDGDPVTTGSVGYPVEFDFDPAWDGLDKIAVFRGSHAEAQRTLSEDTISIPPEVLTVAGSILWIGVRGENADGSLVIPTLWLRVGYLPEGVGEAEIPERQLPPGGTTGQVVTKLSDADYDAGWEDPQGGSGTGNYNELENRPQIGGVTIEGNKTPAQYGLVAAQQGAGLITDTERQQIGENTDDIAELQGEQRQQGTDLQQLQDDVDAIEEKIPNQASAQNQLADKDFVNSSINSSTAFFRGSFASRAALLAVAWQTSDPSAANYVSNNDYAYVQDDESQNDEAWRYIYVLETGGQNNGWQPQFRVNESPLTAAQVAALNSGATAALIAQITANQTAIAGKYTKPAAGIPASDLAAGVIPSVPTKTSELQNDSGFLTLATLPIYNGGVT